MPHEKCLWLNKQEDLPPMQEAIFEDVKTGDPGVQKRERVASLVLSLFGERDVA